MGLMVLECFMMLYNGFIIYFMMVYNGFTRDGATRGLLGIRF